MTTTAPARRARTSIAEVESLVPLALAGDGAALDALLRAVQDDVHNLAVRMLWCPDDAADATQEILVKVATGLATFRGESSLRTWVWRVATNHLLNIRRSRVEREEPTFVSFGAELAVGLSEASAAMADDPARGLLEEEVKIGCTQGMLLCLDRDHRIAYVLGEVFGLTGQEAGEVLDIPAATFRKRLSRARGRLREFMRGQCGLLRPERPCRCSRRVDHAVRTGVVRGDRLLFAGGQPPHGPTVDREVGEMEDLHVIASLFRSHPRYATPARVVEGAREVLTSGRYSLVGPEGSGST